MAGRAGLHPFDGPRSTPYPLPPLDAHPVAAEVERVCRDRGLHPFPTPRAINSRPRDGRPACAYCDICASYGCPVGARGTSQEALLPAVEATGRCEVRPRSMVKEVLIGGDGRAMGVAYLDAEGKEREVAARLVCVSASAVESARLLLLSRSPRFPDGLGNGQGQVGRHLQFHGFTMGRALFPHDGLGAALADDPHPFVGRSLMDDYFLPEGRLPLAKGGVLRFGRQPQVPEIPEQGRLWKEEHGDAEDTAARTLYFEGFHDFLPNEGTFVELDPEIRDPWGLPVARIHLDLPAHHRQSGEVLASRAYDVFGQLGAIDGALTDLGGTSAYLVHGTCRAGHDPESSVLDPGCRVHGVPNLFVVDGSFMPTSGGAPPTLTIHANALRVADLAIAHLGH
ncbi:MAG: GMC family oxidoreductase [Holophagales bacterium]|nr:GMC family oxidoreductase [Holophagales bacterium]